MMKSVIVFLFTFLFSTFTSASSPETLREVANQAHPDLHGLSPTGIQIEHDVQKHIDQSAQLRRPVLPRHKRAGLLELEATSAESARNQWHMKEDDLNKKLQRSNKIKKAFSKIPKIGAEAKRKTAEKMKSKEIKKLNDIAKDSTIHHHHGHLIHEDLKVINEVKFPLSRELGYSTPKASPTRDSQHGSKVGSGHLHYSDLRPPFGSPSQ